MFRLNTHFSYRWRTEWVWLYCHFSLIISTGLLKLQCIFICNRLSCIILFSKSDGLSCKGSICEWNWDCTALLWLSIRDWWDGTQLPNSQSTTISPIASQHQQRCQKTKNCTTYLCPVTAKPVRIIICYFYLLIIT